MFFKPRDPPYCCLGLTNLVAVAGQAGLSALVRDDGEHIRMQLQSRGIAYDDEHLLAEAPEPRDRIWHISVSTGLTYCPFCGTEIRRLIRAAPNHFKALARVHFRYADDNPGRPVLRRRSR